MITKGFITWLSNSLLVKSDKHLLFTSRNYFSNEYQTGTSSSKKYTSSFKLRSRLAQFFKHIHPDQMNQAPTKIKQQNMRSLKNFNEYIDAINQQKSIQGKLLKFYISQKTNHKSKKFYSFNLQLPQVQSPKMNDQKAQRLLDDIVNALNNKFNQAQLGPNGAKKSKKSQNIFRLQQNQTEQIKIQSQQQKIQREQQTIKPFQQYKSYKDRLTEQRLKNEINSKFVQSEKSNLQSKLRKNVSFADTASSKPMMWARLSMQEGGIYKNYQEILNSLLDPKLIYFEQKLTDMQVQEFKKKLLPGGLDPLTLRNNDYINDVCEQMQSFDPPFCFLVSSHYSGNQIPGFFTVPYNFKPKQLKQKFDELKGLIQEQQQTYIQYFDYFKQIQKQLRQNNSITVDLKQFNGNNDISDKILMMKRLSRYIIHKPDGVYNKNEHLPIFYPMTEDEFKIALDVYFKNTVGAQQLLGKSAIEVNIKGKNKIFHLINFRDEDMEKVVNNINIRMQLNQKYGKQDDIMEKQEQHKKTMQKHLHSQAI